MLIPYFEGLTSNLGLTPITLFVGLTSKLALMLIPYFEGLISNIELIYIIHFVGLRSSQGLMPITHFIGLISNLMLMMIPYFVGSTSNIGLIPFPYFVELTSSQELMSILHLIALNTTLDSGSFPNLESWIKHACYGGSVLTAESYFVQNKWFANSWRKFKVTDTFVNVSQHWPSCRKCSAGTNGEFLN